MKSSWKFILGLTIALTAVLSIMMTAFSVPAVNSGVHQVPIGLITPDDPTYQKVSEPLKAKGFKVEQYKSENTVKKQVDERKIYGAIALSDTGDVTVYQATAASSAVAQALNQIGTGIVEQQKVVGTKQLAATAQQATDPVMLKTINARMTALQAKQVKIVELKSFPKADPKGTGLAAGALPIALGGWIGSVAIVKAVKGKWQKFAAILCFAMIGGLGLIAVIQFGIGTFDGNYWLTSLGAMLGIAATGFFVLGLLEVIGNWGLAIAAITLILLGNPLSGLTSAPEMLPSGWGAFGQLLPPGATGTLLRNLALFDGHAALMPIAVLSSYVLVGMLLFKLGNKSEI
ncbi:ABC transporter permease [Convivina praedatoris]|uniref:ABC-2 type transporter transmembrane domain-containing protein n=1 Tax=Convivina praedatoris TaxID=2880963 RepID=A0ABM9D2J1_9LACO|nr:ABC transporter permease [Convivina sp. LMG 32447]CAH1852161.1 hypothetical protein LMG032447_00509 [Convivina sp. LMG 32447]CAH1852192.1 hypothetical protein R078138_00519 [Convivina sp. LMG 32447]CAH1852754.1 hypothetical protein R077815_00598 [Convivina sp. LMG 32447]